MTLWSMPDGRRPAMGLLAASALILFVFMPARTASAIEYGGEKYQLKLVDEARAQNHLEPEPAPEGKIIERIVTLPYGVILPEDPYPGFLNAVHVTTVPEVIERELVFHAGDTWTTDAAVESAHNLRNYLFLSAAQVVACKGSTPDRVVALVVTKDLWSLRPNFSFLYADSRLEVVKAQITEQNLAGRMKRATVDLGFDLDTYTGGLQYQDPRIGGGDTSMTERGDLIWNRASGDLEGGVTSIGFQKPLYTLDTRWAWIALAQYRKDIFRLYSAGVEANFTSPTTGESVPYEYDRQQLDTQLGLTRSYGRNFKNDYSVGYRNFVHQYSPTASSGVGQPATQADFEALAVPNSESAGMLYASYHGYEGYFQSLIDIQEFALSEDFRLGPDFTEELRLANPAFGFSSSFLESITNLAWSHYGGDNLFSATFNLDARYQPQLGTSSSFTDVQAFALVRNVSPRFSFLRLHTGAQVGRRFNDSSNTITTLGGDTSPRSYPAPFSLGGDSNLLTYPTAYYFGGDTSLRGYPTAFYYGKNFWIANAELRTTPMVVASIHLGLAAFFDMGAASDNLTQLAPHESVGGGLRIGFPQFNRDLLRIDFGFPLETLVGATPAYIVAEYGQAF